MWPLAGVGKVIEGWDVGLDGNDFEMFLPPLNFNCYSESYLLLFFGWRMCMILRHAGGWEKKTYNPTIIGVRDQILWPIIGRTFCFCFFVWVFSAMLNMLCLCCSFGSTGRGENVPPDSWLVYDIELVKVYWLIRLIACGPEHCPLVYYFDHILFC